MDGIAATSVAIRMGSGVGGVRHNVKIVPPLKYQGRAFLSSPLKQVNLPSAGLGSNGAQHLGLVLGGHEQVLNWCQTDIRCKGQRKSILGF